MTSKNVNYRTDFSLTLIFSFDSNNLTISMFLFSIAKCNAVLLKISNFKSNKSLII